MDVELEQGELLPEEFVVQEDNALRHMSEPLLQIQRSQIETQNKKDGLKKQYDINVSVLKPTVVTILVCHIISKRPMITFFGSLGAIQITKLYLYCMYYIYTRTKYIIFSKYYDYWIITNDF